MSRQRFWNGLFQRWSRKNTACSKESAIKNGPTKSPNTLELGKYCIGALGAIFGWYGIALYAKQCIPEEDRPPRRPLMSRCTVSALPIESCGFPSVSVFVELGHRYKFTLSQAAWAASHFCPIEFHVQLVEDIVSRRLQPGLQRILCEINPREAANLDDKEPEAPREEKSSATLAQRVVALLEKCIKQLEPNFKSLSVLNQVPYETKLQTVCDLIENDENLQRLSVDQRMHLITETLREVIYEFLVANWEASRYFDPSTYKEGLFGPRRTYLSEGVDVGTRGASYLLLDKRSLRLDLVDPERGSPVLQRREQAKKFEREVDRSCLSEPSREARARQLDMQKVGKLAANLRDEYKKAKKKEGKDLHKSPLDHFRYTPSVDVLPHKEDPYATFMSSDEFGPRGLPLSTVEKAVTMLQRYGVVRIRHAFPKEAILHLKRRLFVSPEAARDMGDKLIDVDNNIGVSRRSAGRVTAYIRASSFEPFLVEAQRVWMPLIYSLFPTEQYYGSTAVQELQAARHHIYDWAAIPDDDQDDIQSPAVKEIPTPRMLCSAIQLTSQDRNAPEEGFAVDNASPSLTVLIALDDMYRTTPQATPDSPHPDAGANGALQLIPGTQHIGTLKPGYKARHLWQRNWKEFFYVFFRSNGPVTVPLQAGDVAVWDSRVFRRMLSNGKIKTSSYIIFRYDFIDTPAPSQALPQLLANKLKSRLLFWTGLINRVAFSDHHQNLSSQQDSPEATAAPA